MTESINSEYESLLSPGSLPQKKPSLSCLGMFTMTSFAGVMLFFMQSFSIIVPALFRDAFHHGAAAILGVVSAVLALLQTSALFFAYLTDHCHSPLGRRRPFVLTGTFFIFFGVAAFLFCLWDGTEKAQEDHVYLWIAVGGLYVCAIGVMLAVPAVQALVMDVVPHEKTGVVSGMFAFWSSVGGAGVLLMLALGVTPRVVGFSLAGYTFVAALFTMFSVKEVPLRRTGERTTCRSFWASYAFSPKKHVDFVLLMFHLLIGSFGMCAMQYLQYWLADIARVRNHVVAASWLQLTMTVVTIVCSPIIGFINDRTKKPKHVIMIGIVISMSALITWIFVKDVSYMFIVVALLGLSISSKQTCSMQIAMAILPVRERAAQFLSEFQTCMSLAQVICGQVSGVVLECFAIPESTSSSLSSSLFSASSFSSFLSYDSSSSSSSSFMEEPKYTHTGYVVIFCICLASEFLSFVIMAFINIERGHEQQEKDTSVVYTSVPDPQETPDESQASVGYIAY